jgi:hypothetical protein
VLAVTGLPPRLRYHTQHARPQVAAGRRGHRTADSVSSSSIRHSICSGLTAAAAAAAEAPACLHIHDERCGVAASPGHVCPHACKLCIPRHIAILQQPAMARCSERSGGINPRADSFYAGGTRRCSQSRCRCRPGGCTLGAYHCRCLPPTAQHPTRPRLTSSMAMQSASRVQFEQ